MLPVLLKILFRDKGIESIKGVGAVIYSRVFGNIVALYDKVLNTV